MWPRLIGGNGHKTFVGDYNISYWMIWELIHILITILSFGKMITSKIIMQEILDG